MANPSSERLLLVKLSSLGDVVHALPLLQALRAGLGPDAAIGWAVGRPFAGLLDGNPHLSWDHILPTKKLADVWQLGKELRPIAYDTVLDAQGLFISGLVTALAGAPRRVGFDTNREGNQLFLTDPMVPNTERQHVVQRLLGFCDAVNVMRPAKIEPQTYLTSGDVQALLEPATKTDGPIIGCVVGASIASKSWPAERWVSFIKLLSDSGARPILLGAKSELEATATIVREAGDAIAANLVGETDLRQLATVLANCQVVIGPDSGPTHLAVAVGTPVVGLYGTTDPAKTGVDWGPAPAIILDFVKLEAPPETRRPRHPILPDAIARIPVRVATEAVFSLIKTGAV